MERILVGTWWGLSTTSPERVKTYATGDGYVGVINDGTETGTYVREIDAVRAARQSLRAGAR